MKIENYFIRFTNNISLTSQQKKDAMIKYRGVCSTLHESFYNSDYNGSTKYLFGSYKKRTFIRPIISSQDVDVIFILPNETFDIYKDQVYGQSNLLTNIKEILKEKYKTTDKIKNWGKVILIEFTESKHNVELLPAKQNYDGTFTIPNTENGGSWDIFDAKQGVTKFRDSNKKTNGYTRVFIKILKNWIRQCTTFKLKSYEVDNLVIDYFDKYIFVSYPETLLSILEFLEESNNDSAIITAVNRANKALDFVTVANLEGAVNEYRKIFSTEFPIYNSNTIRFMAKIDSAPYEEFIEDCYLVDINNEVSFDIIDTYSPKSSFRPNNQKEYVKRQDLVFKAVNITGVEEKEITFKWKIRNFGQEAINNKCLRGSIENGYITKTEKTLYSGSHTVDCYILKQNIVIAKEQININII